MTALKTGSLPSIFDLFVGTGFHSSGSILNALPGVPKSITPSLIITAIKSSGFVALIASRDFYLLAAYHYFLLLHYQLESWYMPIARRLLEGVGDNWELFTPRRMQMHLICHRPLSYYWWNHTQSEVNNDSIISAFEFHYLWEDYPPLH